MRVASQAQYRPLSSPFRRQPKLCGCQSAAKRCLHQNSTLKSPTAELEGKNGQNGGATQEKEEPGAMSRRLEAMAEQAIDEGGQRAHKLVAEGGDGFSEELKQKLENMILDAKFRDDNPGAFATLTMPSGAGKGTREMASGPHWTGTESLHDTALRMLDDAHKPLRGTAGATSQPGPKPAAGPPVDLRPKGEKPQSHGQRLRNAIDKTSLYALSQSDTMTERGRAETRAQLQERFTPGARSMPATVAGLQGVASQRIEDAIARGQFRNIPRGRGVGTERDPNASSPFLDTTEYFMNKIIKKQDILPPWVEKQNELTQATERFKGRLRAEWKRHAARVLASQGGTLEEQVRQAVGYARVEERVNPRKKTRETITAINSQGMLTTFSVEAEPDSPPGETKALASEPTSPGESQPEMAPVATGAPDADPPPETLRSEVLPQTAPAGLTPFRDPTWEAAERDYHQAATNELNSITRSYNLMAPALAKRPYFDLARELRACYADVAPQLPDEIRRRAEQLRARVEVIGHRQGGLMDRFATREKVTVYESTRPHYGFKEFWRDVFGGSKEKAGG